MHGIHLVIFCADRYRDVFLKHCVYCVERHVQDPILSRTIVSPKSFAYRNFNVITDDEMWPDIDCTITRDFFWNHAWLRQQILKLSVDQFFTGDVLVLDADLFFLKPLVLVQDQKYNIYFGRREWFQPYWDVIYKLIDENKPTPETFIADFMVFNTDILTELKGRIETKVRKTWIEAVYDAMISRKKSFVDDTPVFLSLSEFELYGTYLISQHSTKINQTFVPHKYHRLRIPLTFDPYDHPKNFLKELKRRSQNRFQCVEYYREDTQWTDFWNTIKDQSWPDCDSQLNFQFLPLHIQKECVEIHQVKKYFPWLPTKFT